MSSSVERWRSIVRTTLADLDSPVPEGFVLAIIEAESGGDPRAYRAEAKVKDGSIGLMQVLYSTAQASGYTGPPGDKASLSGLFDPATNIHYGVKFLTNLWTQLGNAADVASAYNGGVRPWLGFGGVLPEDHPPVTVCLARDSTGQCIKRRTVQPGEYGNADYVNKVLRLTQQYSGAQELPGVVIDGSDQNGGGFASVGTLAAIAALGILVLWGMRK